jgi:hypothetical protein
VRHGGTIALLDYGQSKQLTHEQRLAFARVVQALNKWVGWAAMLRPYASLSLCRLPCRPTSRTTHSPHHTTPHHTTPHHTTPHHTTPHHTTPLHSTSPPFTPRGDKPQISAALAALGVVSSRDDVELRAKMGYGMFDTTGKADPFDPDSPIKQISIERFPPDLFFVLRVIQLLRGLAEGMGVQGFSTARQWGPLAKEALKQERRHLHSGAAPLRAA